MYLFIQKYELIFNNYLYLNLNNKIYIQDYYWKVMIQYCVTNESYKGCFLPESIEWGFPEEE